MVTIHIRFVEASVKGYWLADEDELEKELKKIMPDFKGYSTRGFVDHNGHQIGNIFRVYNTIVPGPYDGKNCIELNIIPKNL